jgi:hypothetical protein
MNLNKVFGAHGKKILEHLEIRLSSRKKNGKRLWKNPKKNLWEGLGDI